LFPIIAVSIQYIKMDNDEFCEEENLNEGFWEEPIASCGFWFPLNDEHAIPESVFEFSLF
jgi:hypothetical protein